MTLGDTTTLVWGAAQWLPFAAGAAAVLLALVLWGYWRAGATRGLRLLAGGLKALGILILALCLLEPLFSGTRARPGANTFAVLADNSQSMTLKDRDSRQTRADQLKDLTKKESPWLARLQQDFDVRQYAFDTQLRALVGAEALPFDGRASALGAALDGLARRYQGRPVAGVLLFSDGIATDAEAVERLVAQASAAGGAKLPPVYPVLVGGEHPADDIGVERIAVTQTNFEDAPVTLSALVTASGYGGRTVVAQLVDESGKPVEQQRLKLEPEGKPTPVRFRVKPEQAGVSFYRVRVAADEGQLKQLDKAGATVAEATGANNSRLVAVDRGRGPYRVLYVAGRPNWEYKFLRRSVQEDDQVKLAGVLRIARREPKFNFLSRAGEETNPLFRGFDPADKQQVEQYDQPVLVRTGAYEDDELRGGFPKTPEELYRFHAVILDDVEAEFFTQDQMLLLKEFVRQRGGGLLMLGGQESFKNGRYDRTPVGDLLPVYADEVPPAPPNARYRLALTREGWLEPWVRLRGEEDVERKRLEAMPAFHTLNQVRGIKPGATVLARAAPADGGDPVPALVEQRFGQGRVGALLIGDLWRWGLRRPADAEPDMEKAWRQTVRWLVADVPRRVEVAVAPRPAGADGGSDGTLVLTARVRDAAYAPLDNATVTVRVTGPDGAPLDLTAEPAQGEAGRYEAAYVPRQPGAYRAQVTATAPDGSEAGQVQTGWTSDPAAEEFHALRPNAELLTRLAEATGGQVVRADELPDFVAGLPTRRAQITEPYIRPVWHQPWVFALAILCLCAEWGLRRWRGLP